MGFHQSLRVFDGLIYCSFYNGMSLPCCINCIPTDCYANWLTIFLHFMKSLCLLTPFDGEFWLHWLSFVQQHDIDSSFWQSRRKIGNNRHPTVRLLLQQWRKMKTRWIKTGNQDIIINNQCWLFSLTQEEIDSGNLSHNLTKVISLDDDDNDVEEVFHSKSSFDPDFHPVSVPSHVPTSEPNNNSSSVPCPQPSAQPSPDPDPIDNIIDGASKSSVLIKDLDRYLAMEQNSDKEYYHLFQSHGESYWEQQLLWCDITSNTFFLSYGERCKSASNDCDTDDIDDYHYQKLRFIMMASSKIFF